MITTIAALYVILPALLALACVAYAYLCPVVITEERSYTEVETEWLTRVMAARDSAARTAVDALKIWHATGVEAWRTQALACYHEALELHNRMHDVCQHQRC